MDAADLRVGDPFPDRIAAIIRDVDYVGIVLSPAAIRSSWVQEELLIALTREREIGVENVIPLLFRPVTLPATLQHRVYADFTDDAEMALGRVLARMGLSPGQGRSGSA